MELKTVGFIGTGNMAGAIINGVCRKQILAPNQLRLLDASPEKTAPFQALGAVACQDLRELVEQSDVIFFCVKPQVLPDVLEELKALSVPAEKLFVSIVAGKKAEYFFSYLGNCKLILTMPNTPLLLGKGATAIGKGYHTTPEEEAFVHRIFCSAGVVGEIPAEKLNESIAVNGSTPAFLYRFCKVVADHAQEMGLDREYAIAMFAATMEGASAMIRESGFSLEELIRMVSSPGGTTLAGLAALDETGFDRSVEQCMDACVKRAYELGK